MLTANQTTYGIRITRKAQIKRGQTFRSRANNKPASPQVPQKWQIDLLSLTAGQRTYEDKTARKAHAKRMQTLRSRANNIQNQNIDRSSNKIAYEIGIARKAHVKRGQTLEAGRMTN